MTGTMTGTKMIGKELMTQRKRSNLGTLLAVIVLLFVASPATAQVIRLASGAPESSPWGAALNRVAADWERISRGRVTLQIFHNGIAGDELDVLRKMRIGQVQAGVFTTAGMDALAPEVLTMSMPVLIRSNEELTHVFAELQGDLERAIERNRFTVLGWSQGGWIYFFTNREVRSPRDLKNVHLAASAENEEILRAFQQMGYRTSPVNLTELLTALNSGMVEGFYASPIAAAGFQWFARAPYMLDLPVAPFLGSVVISDRAWSRVPDNLKPQLIASVERQIASLDAAVTTLESEAIDAMKGFGLTVTSLSDSEREQWFAEFDRSLPATVGSVFHEPTYRTIQRRLEEFRR